MKITYASCGSVLLLALLAGSFARADARSEQGERIRAIVEIAYPAALPGAAAIVVHNGEVVYQGASGMADLEQGVPLTGDSVFRLGSITKQFTAAAMLLLAERGKLSLEDPITKFLPDYPTDGHTITIEHLLTHTSGIASYTSIPGYMGEPVMKDLSTDELIAVFRDLPMDFAPGERYQYSNSGYVLAGAIIEKASGQSYAAFVQENIFDVLGMKDSHYGEHGRIIPRRVRGYQRDGEGFGNAPYISMTQPHAAGSLLSTVADLARWDAALYTDKLLTEASRARMTQPFTLNNGEKSGYGLGFGVGEFYGKRSVSHGGGIHGFVTYATRLPTERIYVAVLSNAPGHDSSPDFVAQNIAAVVMGVPLPDFTEAEVAPDVLASYEGVYQVNDAERRVVMLIDGQLYSQRTGGQRLPLVPHSQTGFHVAGSLAHMEFLVADGKVTGMRMFQAGSAEPSEAPRVDEPVPTRKVVEVDPAVYDRYVGKYELQPGFVLTVTRQGDRLFTQATGQQQIEIFPESDTEFFLKVVDAQLTFVPGDDGVADSVILHQGGREMPARRLGEDE